MIDPHGTRNGSRGRRLSLPAEPERLFGTDQGPERSATRESAVQSATDDRYVTDVNCACALPTKARSRGPARYRTITPERMNRTLSDTVTLSPGALRPPAPNRTSPRFDRVSSARRHCHMVNTGRDASISRKSGEFAAKPCILLIVRHSCGTSDDGNGTNSAQGGSAQRDPGRRPVGIGQYPCCHEVNPPPGE